MLIAPAKYDIMDFGWVNSMLAFIALGLVLVSSVLLWLYGARLRVGGYEIIILFERALDLYTYIFFLPNVAAEFQD